MTSDANANKPVCQIGWEEWRQADLIEIRRTLGLHRMTVPATDGSEMPAASTRGLKRSISAAGEDGAGLEEEDVNNRNKEIEQERKEAWSNAQAHRRRLVTASYVRADRISKEVLDGWWEKQTTAHKFEGVPGQTHRVFVVSGERWNVESGESPWVDEPEATPSLETALDWLLERRGPCDTILVFDGRSSSIREMMERKMKKARHVSELWLVYTPKKEAGQRKVLFGSRNREVGWVSFPVPRTNIPTKDRKTWNEWESSTYSSTFSALVPMAWGQLPSIALADKQKITGASTTPVPASKLFDSDLGCPLVWQEVKSKDVWTAVLEAVGAECVVDLCGHLNLVDSGNERRDLSRRYGARAPSAADWAPRLRRSNLRGSSPRSCGAPGRSSTRSSP